MPSGTFLAQAIMAGLGASHHSMTSTRTSGRLWGTQPTTKHTHRPTKKKPKKTVKQPKKYGQLKKRKK